MPRRDCLRSEGAEAVSCSGDRRAAACRGIRIHCGFYADDVSANTDIRKDEVEGMGAGRVQDELKRRIKVARSSGRANRHDAVAESLRERLNTGVEHHA